MLARVMVLAVFAMGYNLLFGYVGLLSLGHAMFFAAGLYGAGLTVEHLGFGVAAGFLAGLAAGAVLALVVGLLALRTSGVAFMIVTMMFSQVFYLSRSISRRGPRATRASCCRSRCGSFPSATCIST